MADAKRPGMLGEAGAPIGNYAALAGFWDCYFGARTAEISCWAELARMYGTRILSPLAATGAVGFALSQRGFDVVAVDLCREMVREGRKLHPQSAHFSLLQGDVTTLDLKVDLFDFAFLGNGDFHHFAAPASQEAVLASIGRHLRPGGGLALELYAASDRSWSSPRRTFAPLRPPDDPGVTIWKEGSTEYNHVTRDLRIHQTLFVQRGQEVEEHDHHLCLKLLSPDELRRLLDRSGFTLMQEFGSYELGPWTSDADKWIVLATKEE